MSKEYVLQIIRRAIDEGWTELDLSKHDLAALPPEIGKLSQLTELKLTNNELTSLPLEIGRLTKLTKLYLESNRLTSLPQEIGQLTSLTSLNVQSNLLKSLPPEIGQLSQLTEFDLWENQITSLPPEIGQLTRLTEFDVAANQLTMLPPEIGQLTHLTGLLVWGNGLISLPPEIGRLRRLAALDVEQNRLTSLPPEIGQLTQLTVLTVTGNQMSSLPPEIGQLSRLMVLNVDYNRLTSLPPEIGQLSQLKEMDVSKNPLVSPPPAVVDQGTEAILAYLRDLGVSEKPNWRSKMLVVGEAAVGKTSLLKVLRGGEIDPDEKQTHGILIGDLSLSHPTEDGVDMELACWDFGGQEIYRATHQFFLSEESLFLLLWRPRRGDVESRIVHWLTSIHTRAPGSPILVVANQFEGDSPADLDFDQLRQDFPAIVGFCQVNAAAKAGIADLTEAIRAAAEALPMMGQAWPATWHSAATAIRQRDERTLSATAFRQLLQNLELEQEDSRTAFGRSLHLLGDILHFQGDAELEDQVFLKPKWVSDLIVRAIESEQVVAGDGVLTRKHSKALWADVDDHIRDHFTRLMERFDLSYRTPDPERREISLVVDAIPKSRPLNYDAAFRAVAARAGSRTIRLTYDFPSLPAGVPTWFIARAHKFTTHTHWRTGAVFADDPEPSHMALVTASEAERRVAFEVCGPQPTYFLGVLKRQFEDTLRRYPGLEPKITIPCPGHNGAVCDHAFDFRLLRKRLERDKPRYMVKCPVGAANEEIEDPEIDIRHVLYGLHPATIDQVAEDLQAMRRDVVDGHGEIMGALRSLSQQVTDNHLVQWRERQSAVNAVCPAVFAIRRQNKSRAKDAVLGYRWKLHLYCEAPGAWHQTGADGYLINDMPSWLAAVSPYLNPLIAGLRAVAPMAAPMLGVISPADAKALANDLRLMQEFVKKLPDIREARPSRDFDRAAHHYEARLHGAALQALHAFLRAQAPDGPWGGLSKVLTPEGDYLWLCPRHAKKLAR